MEMLFASNETAAVVGHFQFVCKKPRSPQVQKKTTDQSSTLLLHLKLPSLSLFFFFVSCRFSSNEGLGCAGAFGRPPARRGPGATLGTVSRTGRSTGLHSEGGTSNNMYSKQLECTETVDMDKIQRKTKWSPPLRFCTFISTLLSVENRLVGRPAARFIESTEVCRFIHNPPLVDP